MGCAQEVKTILHTITVSSSVAKCIKLRKNLPQNIVQVTCIQAGYYGINHRITQSIVCKVSHGYVRISPAHLACSRVLHRVRDCILQC